VRCEVCGRQIMGKPISVIIEGAEMLVCSECSRLGTTRWKTKPKPEPMHPARKAVKPLPRAPTKQQTPPAPSEALELVNDFSLLVRQARERMGLTHEDLGRKIGEKVSVLRKIESGRMTPDHRVAGKLEHTLKVKLLAPLTEPKLPSTASPPRGEITLGEIVQMRKKTEEEERKPS